MGVNDSNQYLITVGMICHWLGVKGLPIQDQVVSNICFAREASMGSAAIVSYITGEINYVTQNKDCIVLAEQAIAQGAAVLISNQQIKDYPCIVVKNPVEAYAICCGKIKDLYAPKTVAVTGSIGKTSTLEMVRSVLSKSYKTHSANTSANVNTMHTAGLVVQRLNCSYEAYTQEIAEGPPFGAAQSISRIVKPDISVITVVGTSHLEIFGSQERILESCLGIQYGMPEDGLLVLNADDPFQWGATAERRVVYYGIENEKADYHATDISSNLHGCSFTLQYDGVQVPVKLSCLGKHNVANACAAFAVGKELGMADEQILEGLKAYEPEGIRQHLVSYNGCSIYLDCYNSAYESLVTAVKTIEDIGDSASKKIAVLGDILELGEMSDEVHRKIGHFLVKSKIDTFVFFGTAMKNAYEVCVDAGRDALWTDKREQLDRYIEANVKKNNLFLVKGSRRMELELSIDHVFGTGYHETHEYYEKGVKRQQSADFSFTVFSDHVTINKYLGKEKAVTIPSEMQGIPVTAIGVSCFSQNQMIEEVIIPAGVVQLRKYAFFSCKNLKKVELPESLCLIENGAFNSCVALRDIHLGENVTDIGYRGFAWCYALDDLYIPQSVQSIGDEAFVKCHISGISVKKDSYAQQYFEDRKSLFSKVKVVK